MVCPECHGTGKKLVEVQADRGRGWVKADCGCDGGYVFEAGSQPELALESAANPQRIGQD